MDMFYKESFNYNQIKDKGVDVKEVVKLIEGSVFYEDLMDLFNMKNHLKEFIPIPGAGRLVKTILDKDNEFIKFDIKKKIKDVECKEIFDSSKITLRFDNIKDDKTLKISQSDSIEAESIYSVKHDFFENLYHMNHFADYCIKGKNEDIVFDNLDSLKQIYGKKKSHERRYRLLKDKEDNYYVRAITSTNRYNDYNNRFAVFIALMSLNENITKLGEKYKIFHCEYNESNIRVYFEKFGSKRIEGVGEAKFILELANDEIKREAMRFSGLYAISIEHQDKEKNIIIKPKNLKSKIVSVRHNVSPQVVVADIAQLRNLKKHQTNLYNEISQIKHIKNPDQLRHVLFAKIRNSKVQHLKPFKTNIQELDKKIDSFHELLVLLDKISMIVSDIDAKEYLRYIAYDIFVTKNK